MITESDIRAFAPAQQARIRAEIHTLVKNGRDPRFLVLTRIGEVAYDREAETDALDLEHHGRQSAE